MFGTIAVTDDERAAPREGDDLVPGADVVMDRAFTLRAAPAEVWPWLVQLGKRRAGWYLPRSVERFVPPSRRALRVIDARWQGLAVGDTIPDYGGRHETFDARVVDPPRVLVYTSRRGAVDLSWSITLVPVGEGTRVFFRLRLGGVKRKRLAETAGGFFDALTLAGLAEGLEERVTPGSSRR
ncbi:SRPBCC family protein [Phycicoccus avicenniae]|uniref:SRPBCC family protein n=1 Tax=Phycicoccus avicenniae TaxID=2828860 RepID=UPI003D2B4F7B